MQHSQAHCKIVLHFWRGIFIFRDYPGSTDPLYTHHPPYKSQMSDQNQARGRSRKGLSVDFKGLRLYDDEGNVEYHHHQSTPSNKEKETHRGRSGREQSPRRRRVEETESHHHRKDHGRHGSGHHNVHQVCSLPKFVISTLGHAC